MKRKRLGSAGATMETLQRFAIGLEHNVLAAFCIGFCGRRAP